MIYIFSADDYEDTHVFSIPGAPCITVLEKKKAEFYDEWHELYTRNQRIVKAYNDLYELTGNSEYYNKMRDAVGTRDKEISPHKKFITWLESRPGVVTEDFVTM